MLLPPPLTSQGLRHKDVPHLTLDTVSNNDKLVLQPKKVTRLIQDRFHALLFHEVSAWSCLPEPTWGQLFSCVSMELKQVC